METLQPRSARLIAWFQGRSGDGFGAVEHGLDRRRADQPQQAADHPVAAVVQIVGQFDQGVRAVVVQPQAVFQRGDQGVPLLAPAEGPGADHGEASGDLLTRVPLSSPARSTLMPA